MMRMKITTKSLKRIEEQMAFVIWAEKRTQGNVTWSDEDQVKSLYIIWECEHLPHYDGDKGGFNPTGTIGECYQTASKLLESALKTETSNEPNS